nr:putative ATP-dependent protease La (LON), substrate-binding domain, PUA-like protein [Ipomoea batatas]GMD81809.1 putative ATP-dependent protease La (LON), substrate-binding domain, PUA-like protein [Ipomoea batatas]
MTANSIGWVKKASLLDCDTNFIPSMAELVSFAALQPVSGASQSDLVKLQKEKLRAMRIKDTTERLDLSSRYVRDNISLVAAKLAIQSLDAPSS